MGDNVAVLGFPCNQFGHQMNANNNELLNELYYVRPGNQFEPHFYLFEKVLVNGANAIPLFKWMKRVIPIPNDPPKDTKMNGVDDSDILILPREGFDGTTTALWSPVSRSDIAWNFEKFLFDRSGNLVKRFSRYFPTNGVAEYISREMLQVDDL